MTEADLYLVALMVVMGGSALLVAGVCLALGVCTISDQAGRIKRKEPA